MEGKSDLVACWPPGEFLLVSERGRYPWLRTGDLRDGGSMTTQASRTRVCHRTGMNLAQSPSELVYRVGQTSYGAVSAPVRSVTALASNLSRYDTAGRTLYAAGSPEVAFIEVLAQFSRELGSGDDPLRKDAEAIGLTLEEFLEQVAAEWAERHFMNMGCVPKSWRERRALYSLELPADGWWIDVEGPDTIAALAREVGDLLAELGIKKFTTAVLRGEDREATTLISTWCRDLTLDDGSEALGLRFGSKWGGGDNWAYWMRRTDLGLDGEAVRPADEIPVELSTPGLADAARRLRVTVC